MKSATRVVLGVSLLLISLPAMNGGATEITAAGEWRFIGKVAYHPPGVSCSAKWTCHLKPGLWSSGWTCDSPETVWGYCMETGGDYEFCHMCSAEFTPPSKACTCTKILTGDGGGGSSGGGGSGGDGGDLTCFTTYKNDGHCPAQCSYDDCHGGGEN